MSSGKHVWARTTAGMPVRNLSVGDVVIGLGVVEAVEANPIRTAWVDTYNPMTDETKGQALNLEDIVQVVIWQ